MGLTQNCIFHKTTSEEDFLCMLTILLYQFQYRDSFSKDFMTKLTYLAWLGTKKPVKTTQSKTRVREQQMTTETKT